MNVGTFIEQTRYFSVVFGIGESNEPLVKVRNHSVLFQTLGIFCYRVYHLWSKAYLASQKNKGTERS